MKVPNTDIDCISGRLRKNKKGASYIEPSLTSQLHRTFQSLALPRLFTEIICQELGNARLLLLLVQCRQQRSFPQQSIPKCNRFRLKVVSSLPLHNNAW